MKIKSIAIAALAFVAFVAVAPGCKSKKDRSVQVGGACDEDSNCVAFAECMTLDNEKKICTKSCVPANKECPAPLTCEKVSLTQTVGTKNLGTVDVFRCVPQ